jgi:hypothetical protein
LYSFVSFDLSGGNVCNFYYIIWVKKMGEEKRKKPNHGTLAPFIIRYRKGTGSQFDIYMTSISNCIYVQLQLKNIMSSLIYIYVIAPCTSICNCTNREHKNVYKNLQIM